MVKYNTYLLLVILLQLESYHYGDGKLDNGEFFISTLSRLMFFKRPICKNTPKTQKDKLKCKYPHEWQQFHILLYPKSFEEKLEITVILFTILLLFCNR